MANWADPFIGRILRWLGNPITPRSNLNFGSGFTIADDPDNDTTIVTASGGGGDDGGIIVNTIADMRAIATASLLNGTKCWVQSVRRSFVLESITTTESAAEDIYNSDDSTKKWIGTEDTDSRYWMRQPIWGIDNSGNVEASGDATHPIPEAERRRRMGSDPDWLGVAYHLILADTTAVCLEGRTETNCVIYCHASATYGNGLAAGATAGTANTVQALSGNTPWAVTVTAFTDWSGKSTLRYRQTSGANLGSVAWSTLQDGTTHNKSRFTYFTPPPANWTSAPFVFPTVSDTGPANGTTFSLEALPSVAIEINLKPGRITSTGTFSVVVLDSLTAVVSGESPLTDLFAYGCQMSSTRSARMRRMTLHNCEITTLLDQSLKTIIGGFQKSGLGSVMFSPVAVNSGSASGSVIDRFTMQGGVTGGLSLCGDGDPGILSESWSVNTLAFYDTTSPFVFCGGPVSFASALFVGTGNTDAYLRLGNGTICTEGSGSNKFSAQTVVTSGTTQVQFGDVASNPRTTFTAFDESTATILAPQNATFANLDAEMDLNGAVTDMVTNAGFTRHS